MRHHRTSQSLIRGASPLQPGIFTFYSSNRLPTRASAIMLGRVGTTSGGRHRSFKLDF
jgi:hypothetical protein